MWMFKPFSGKEQAGLEGRLLEIGNEKIRVHNAIAEGGFSCVYLAHDAVNVSKQYALKHMICQDGESLDLAMKEIQVMKLLKGHPNVVPLVAHSILDMGRRKEVLLVLEFCEMSLVNVLDSRGAGYFEEKQVLLIFRDVCNAVYAMHSLSPPIAHRDLKAENVLLGFEGAWKLCDFGSTSTNHKCFDRPEEMGIEEDNIRKHTTPAYRAPEMWDLYRREVICDKVDIWALGCLLYRICYLKSAFDGESKLQILNGNYRIPELPKYNASITGIIKDMLQGSPYARPDITQVWFRVNELLPVELQKHLPDSAEPALPVSIYPEGAPTPVKPKRSPPQSTLGAFWSTQFAQDSQSSINNNINKSRREEELEAEVEMLKEQLKQSNLDKVEISSKYEKLSSICRSQRHEIQELRSTSDTQIEKTAPELEPKVRAMSPARHSKSVRSANWRPSSGKHPESIRTVDEWGFGQDGFTAFPSFSSETSSSSPVPGQRFAAANAKKVESSHPAGWAGF